VSITHGLKGPNHAVVTACSTGAHAIGDAARLIMWDDADVMVAGGAESPVVRIALAGFAACRALSTGFNDEPTRASRPYDKARDGFVIGEGAGVVVLEEYEHAKSRGATIYAEVIGYGLSGDAHHITAPAEDGDGAFRCMMMALKRAGIPAAEIDYINAHGTSTPLGDEIELNAVQRVVGNAAAKIAMSSTKSSIGHLLGAAGAVEAIFSVLAIRDDIAPPTINLDNPSVETAIDLVPHKARKKEINTVLSNSFGFGGTNASLILRAVD
jgi:3-oxoacyl-[acyl-carrier-protein] synthase II